MSAELIAAVTRERADYCLMQSWMPSGGYVFLVWPQGLDAKGLEMARGLVNLQLDQFIARALANDYGRIEYESWLAVLTQSAVENAGKDQQ